MYRDTISLSRVSMKERERKIENECRQSNVNVFACINRQRSDVSFCLIPCFNDALLDSSRTRTRSPTTKASNIRSQVAELLLLRVCTLEPYRCSERACFNEHILSLSDSLSFLHSFEFARSFSLQVVAITCAYKSLSQNAIG